MFNSNILAVNIPADGLFLAILNKANNDFSNENCSEIIKRYIDKHLEAKPDIILLNVCYRRCLTPSNVFDSYLYNIETDKDGFALKNQNNETIKTLSPATEGVSKYFSSFFLCARALLQNGIDIYKILTEYIRQKGVKVYFSLRMNDGHYTDNPAINSSFALKDGGVHTINHDGAELDFSQRTVHNYFYRYIKELIENYDIDGIELDWLRHPTVLPLEKRSDYNILNDYMKTIRQLLKSHNGNLGLAVRVLPNESDNLNNGVDVCQWIADGTVDIVTIENFYIPANFEMPISEWKTNINKINVSENPYKLLCGADWAVSCVERYNIAMTPALVRGFTHNCLSIGADGIYLFNFFEENDTSSFELAFDDLYAPYLKNCFVERMKAVKEFEELPRRYVHIGSTNRRYPVTLSANGCYEFTHKIEMPFNNCKIIIGCNLNCSFSVCTDNLEQLSLHSETVFKDFEYIPETQIGKSEFIYAVSQAAPFVKSAILPIREADHGLLKISIQNNSAETVNILWIELYVE